MQESSQQIRTPGLQRLTGSECKSTPSALEYRCVHAGTATDVLVRISAALSGHSLQVEQAAGRGGRGGLVLPGGSGGAGGGGTICSSAIAAALFLCRQTPFAAGRNEQEECR